MTSCCVLLLAGFLPVVVVSAEDQSSVEQSLPDLSDRWVVSVTAVDARHDGMEETFRLNPMMRLPNAAPFSAREYLINWEEEDIQASVSFRLLRVRHACLWFGLTGGAGRGRFHASNAKQQSEEFWGPEVGFLSGYTAGIELRMTPERGPFLRGTYAWQTVETDDNRLHLTSPYKRPNQGDNTSAVFKWEEDVLSITAGWSFRFGTPMIGTRCSTFDLSKDLSYWLPDDGSDPIVTALNSEGEHYHYRYKSNWETFVGVEWDITRSITLGCDLGVTGDRYNSANMRINF